MSVNNTKRKIVMDMEANNLYPAVTVLHCAVATDLVTSESFQFRPEQMINGEFTDFLDSCDFIACHNGIGFDFPAIEKVLGWKPTDPSYLFDTLVFSRTLSPDRLPPFGARFPHSVESWGRRFGIKKPEYEQWETYDEEMMHRCSEDTRIQTMMFKVLCQEAGFDIKHIDPRNPDGYRKGEPNWAESLYNEHRSSTIMFAQEMNGCSFDFERALEFIKTLNDFSDEKSEYILRNIPISYKQYGVSVSAPFKMNGDYKKMTTDWYEDEVHLVGGPFSRIQECILNLNSAKQLKDWLYTVGWVPDEWNYKKNKAGKLEKDEDGNLIKTSPKITQSSLDRIDGHLGECISLRNKANHKRNQLQGFCDRTNKQTLRIPAGANPQGTPTARMKHRNVANVPKASSFENKKDKNDPRNGSLLWFPEKQDPFFGTEMRSVFKAADNKVLVGRDAAGLEFRCFAHYVGDEELIDVILNQDIHTYNQLKAGLPTRSIAKTFILTNARMTWV